MELGLLGLAQAGKKTVFSLLTGTPAEAAPKRRGIRYGTAVVRDPRVDRLSAMYNPKRTRYAEFGISLLPDVQSGGSAGADWLDPLRGADAFLQVVRVFDDPRVFHPVGSVDPVRDIADLQTELLLADLALTENRLERIARDNRTVRVSEHQAEAAVLEICRSHLDGEAPLRVLELTAEQDREIAHLGFLTRKPVVTVLNAADDLAGAAAALAPLVARLESEGGSVVLLSAALELEMADLPADERAEFMEELGVQEPASHRLSRAAFEALGLLSFFTVGPDEVRAWPLRRGRTAPAAAGVIHSDLERGFIRADVASCTELLAAGSERAAKELNLFSLKGKDYIVQDGDVLEVRFSV
ncbi:MAG: redox-regulated ATPase YchF [Kiritimatiellaeota bacterium]|nr:redox-regulated ATPase YchF [Kiritimatiellota bacterium]